MKRFAFACDMQHAFLIHLLLNQAIARLVSYLSSHFLSFTGDSRKPYAQQKSQRFYAEQKKRKSVSFVWNDLRLLGAIGVEPTTSTMSRWHSPTELRALFHVAVVDTYNGFWRLRQGVSAKYLPLVVYGIMLSGVKTHDAPKSARSGEGDAKRWVVKGSLGNAEISQNGFSGQWGFFT